MSDADFTSWHGPYLIRELLEVAIDKNRDFPQEDGGIYVVTQKPWTGSPHSGAKVLYIGGNTGASKRFRTRVGDLIADMCGFFGNETGHHSGGQSLWKWCTTQNVKPLDLYIGWQRNIGCKRCSEINAFIKLNPALNKNRPSKCPDHKM